MCVWFAVGNRGGIHGVVGCGAVTVRRRLAHQCVAHQMEGLCASHTHQQCGRHRCARRSRGSRGARPARGSSDPVVLAGCNAVRESVRRCGRCRCCEPRSGGAALERSQRTRTGNARSVAVFPGGGRHCLFPVGTPAVWTTDRTQWINDHPVVVTAGTGGGVFASTPLADIGEAYTIVAVWRTTAAGGHPLVTRLGGSFTATTWVETIDTKSRRTLEAPNTVGAGTGEAVIAAWTRNAGTFTVALRGTGDAAGRTGGGYLWTGTHSSETWTASVDAFTLGK